MSAAECERSSNTTISFVRSSVLFKTVAALMCISLAGPQISDFNLENYVKLGLRKNIAM
jgi:hypothetical protein